MASSNLHLQSLVHCSSGFFIFYFRFFYGWKSNREWLTFFLKSKKHHFYLLVTKVTNLQATFMFLIYAASNILGAIHKGYPICFALFLPYLDIRFSPFEITGFVEHNPTPFLILPNYGYPFGLVGLVVWALDSEIQWWDISFFRDFSSNPRGVEPPSTRQLELQAACD